MEITHPTFDRLCLLLKCGYRINGSNDKGLSLKNQNQATGQSLNDLRVVCGNCGCQTEGNCRPEVETGTDTAEIYAKIK